MFKQLRNIKLPSFGILLFGLIAAMVLGGCASRSYRFSAAPPVWDMKDRQPVPLPETSKYIRADYYFKVLVRRPAVSVFNYAPSLASRDVNSRDHVPASSWFTPRLGYTEITPEVLLRGPQEIGPPQLPVRVVRAKHLGENPGFVIADRRDRLYLLKFDPQSFPGVETTTAFIVNRLFWGFGYNVPEDYIFYFNSAEVPIDPTADITTEEVQLVLDAVAPPINGIYRATASLLIDGIYLGPIADKGVRKDDPNDRFPHEQLRVLRALKVFGAFTNQTDIRIDNTLDVYVGAAGEGYVKHYLLDFGEALGAHGTERGRLWDGFAHVFSFGEMFSNIATLGLKTHRWEKIRFTPWKSVGAFEAAHFDPLNWKESYPFEPIKQVQPADCYWAAKIVAAITRQHLALLVNAANYPEAGAADYVLETLLQRRQKIIDAHFGMVSPLEFDSLSGNRLRLIDYGMRYAANPGLRRCEVNFYSDRGKKLTDVQWIDVRDETIEITLPPEIFDNRRTYVRVSVCIWRDGIAAPRAAEFHLQRLPGGDITLAGVVH